MTEPSDEATRRTGPATNELAAAAWRAMNVPLRDASTVDREHGDAGWEYLDRPAAVAGRGAVTWCCEGSAPAAWAWCMRPTTPSWTARWRSSCCCPGARTRRPGRGS